MIRLLIVDDHAVVRQGLTQLFETVPGVEVIGVAADGEQAVTQVQTLGPDVVLMDIGMPRLDGIEATRRMAATHPGLPILILTGHADQQRRDQALQAGACGCLLKQGDSVEVIEAVQRAYANAPR
jgi:DNA-binding NarL/FixJ family response regulator